MESRREGSNLSKAFLAAMVFGMVGLILAHPILDCWFRLRRGMFFKKSADEAQVGYEYTITWANLDKAVSIITVSFSITGFILSYLDKDGALSDTLLDGLPGYDSEPEPGVEIAEDAEVQSPPPLVVVEENSFEKRLRAAGYTGPIPDEFLCPISRSIKTNCYIAATGEGSANRTYDGDTVASLQKNHDDLEPINRKKITAGFIRDLDLEAAKERWVQEIERKAAKKREKNIRAQPITRENLQSAQVFFQQRQPVANADKQAGYKKLRRSWS